MNETSTAHRSGREIDLLDLVAVVAESWKLLFFAPLVAAAIAAAANLALSTKYESQAILAIGKDVATLKSPNILRPVIKKLELQGELSPDLDQATRILAKRVSLAPYGDNYYLVGMTASDPTLAQTILANIIAQVYKQSVPRRRVSDQLKERIEVLQASTDRQRKYENLLAPGAHAPGTGTGSVDGAHSLALIENNILNNQSEITRLQKELEGLAPDQTIMSATLPEHKQPAHTPVVAVLAALATSAVVLFYVLVNDAYRRGRMNPQTEPKLLRIRRAISMRRSSDRVT